MAAAAVQRSRGWCSARSTSPRGPASDDPADNPRSPPPPPPCLPACRRMAHPRGIMRVSGWHVLPGRMRVGCRMPALPEAQLSLCEW